MKNFIRKQIDSRLAILMIIGFFAVAILAIALEYGTSFYGTPVYLPPIHSVTPPSIIPTAGLALKNIKKFSSEEEFKEYLQEAATQAEYFGGSSFAAARGGADVMTMESGKGLAAPSAAPERVSETTVQVPGIDEPDIVKTDGKEIYFSRGYMWRVFREEGIGFPESKMVPPFYNEAGVSLVKAFPPADLTLDGEIKGKAGDLLLNNNILAVFSKTSNEIFGYNISDPKSPEKKWQIKLEDRSSIVAARLYKNKIYLVTQNTINVDNPCPIRPLMANDKALTIGCGEIYHPDFPVPTDVTFTAMIVDFNTGAIEKNVSFVGSSAQSIVYMSESSIYITYSYYGSITKFLSDFFIEKMQDIIPASTIQKMVKLDTYDISQQAKIMEIQTIIEKYLTSLNNDELLRVQNELTNRMSDYYKERKRDIGKTGIVKIKLDGFDVAANGSVPGFPLNQFSLDEYNEHLRVAVTVGERMGLWFGLGGGQSESANDVYTLDKELKVVGAVTDMGKGERIYSVRFIGDKGYVVTFRQTDPFYVLDLSNPKNPALKGELKIPGYSSYLHPISGDRILGIGKEGWQVKVSLFDVSSAINPQESAKYILDEGWSDVLNNYHAFLLDKKHQIFFLPGGKGGYVFSYKDDKLSLVKAVEKISARRAIYIDDYLYIIGDNDITVLNEKTWEKVKELSL